MSAGPASDEVAVIIPARNEADRIQATVTAALGLPAAAVVIVVDDGSKDGTAAAARSAGAVVTRHARNRGKGAAMETGAEAVRLLDQREQRARPRHLLFLDA
ncbi:MAG TPA: glycosyltransferase, partial [Streptosporangiaceae bacterium]|nr:glycosyltransferase [Streptosporangiaceae bacterium]